jgi:O-antigen/teichoic acid export membrane protein
MTGHERDAAFGITVGATANVILNALLIPRWGMEGAAIATGFSLLLWNVILVVRTRQRLGIRPTALGFV